MVEATEPRPDVPGDSLERWRRVLCGVAAALAGLVYLNALDNPFVYDDYSRVVENTSIRDLWNIRAIVMFDLTRPILNFSYAVDRAIWGPGPFGFHLTGVLLHVVNVCLLFHLAWRLAADRRESTGADPGAGSTLVAFAAAALLAVHPMMTEAVGYVSGRSEVICGTWFLLAVLCGRRWLRGDGVRWAVLTIGLWVVALASKEIAAMLSLVLVACDWLVLGGTAAERRRRAVTVHLPLFLLAATAALIRLAILSGVEHPGSVAVHWSYLLIAVDVVRRYLWLLVNPAGQAAFHEVAAIRGPFEAQALIDLAVLAIVAAVVWRTRRIEPLASFGLVWFLLLLVPSSVLIVLDRGEPMAEHRVYLASCGAFLAAGATIGWIVARAAAAGHRAPLVARAVLTVGVLSLAVQTVLRNEVWSTPETLWRESVDRAPTHYRPRLLLGEAMLDAGRGEEAIEEFRVAVQLRPEEPAGYMKLGLGLAELRRFDEATATFKELEEVAPASPLPPIGLGTVAMQSRRLAQARQLFEEAIARDPGNVSARQSLALLAEMEEADPSTVLRLCEEIQRLAPWTPGNDECIRRNRSRLEIGSRHD